MNIQENISVSWYFIALSELLTGGRNMTKQNSCETCHYFKADTTSAIPLGDCRRFPPKNFTRHPTQFPDVLADSWCGEWAPKSEPKP